MPWTLGPFCVMGMTPHTLTIYENGIYSAVTIDRVSTAINLRRGNSISQHKTTEERLATDLQETDCTSEILFYQIFQNFF